MTVTSALSDALPSLPPLKMSSAEFFTRITFERAVPRTKQRASTMFDFPEPLRPTTTLKSTGNCTDVFRAKDLKPFIVMFVIRGMEGA